MHLTLDYCAFCLPWMAERGSMIDKQVDGYLIREQMPEPGVSDLNCFAYLPSYYITDV